MYFVPVLPDLPVEVIRREGVVGVRDDYSIEASWN